MAESTHIMTNIIQATAIIGGLGLVALTGEEVFDPIVALGLAGYMGFTAIGMIRTAVDDIMDRALPGEDLRVICDVLVAHKDDVRSFHRLRTRRSGAVRQIDMHLGFDAGVSVEEAHKVCESIDRDIKEALPGSVIVLHVEPDYGAGEQSLEELVEEVMGGAA